MDTYSALAILCLTMVVTGYVILVIKLYKRFGKKLRRILIFVGVLDILVMIFIVLWVIKH